MLQVAIYQLEFTKANKVAIVTCNEFLLKQLKKDITDLLPECYRERVICINSSSPLLAFPKCDVALIDEYDKTLEDLVNIARDGGTDFKLCGLAGLKQVPRIIVFSAT